MGTIAQLRLRHPDATEYQVSLKRKSEFEQPNTVFSGMTADRKAGSAMQIATVQKGSPAFRVGLRSGDQILFLNGKAIAKMTIDQIASEMAASKPVMKIMRREGRRRYELFLRTGDTL